MSDERITFRIRGRNYQHMARRPIALDLLPSLILGLLVLAAVIGAHHA